MENDINTPGSPPRWIKASKSNKANGDCVEAKLTDDGVAVRDSKNPAASFGATGAGWQALLDSVRR
jgi:hypothetical protein